MYYTIYKDVNGHWRWRLSAANHQVIASGEAYANRADCEHVINLVKASGLAPVYDR